MLKIQDKDGRTKFIWSDFDDEPLSIDDVILDDEDEGEEDADNGVQGTK